MNPALMVIYMGRPRLICKHGITPKSYCRRCHYDYINLRKRNKNRKCLDCKKGIVNASRRCHDCALKHKVMPKKVNDKALKIAFEQGWGTYRASQELGIYHSAVRKRWKFMGLVK